MLKTKNCFFILAPMDDVTDTVFRRIVADCAAPDMTMTEFVNVDGLCSVGRPKLMHRLSVAHDSVPVIAQIWGKTPENFKTIANEISTGFLGDTVYENWLARGAQNNEVQGDTEARSETYRRYVDASTGGGNTAIHVQGSGAVSSAEWQASPLRFSGVDLNFGCPEKSVLKNECCSALQQPHLRHKAVEIIKATQDGLAGRLPLSLKTRLGFDSIDYTWHQLLLEQKPAMLTVHVRTTRQMSKVPAQWEAIVPILELRDKISPETKIVMNGDIMNYAQGEELAEKYGVDGIMIGRGVFHDPYIFAKTSPWESMTKKQRIELLVRHIKLHAENYPNGERPFNPLKKFAKVYIQSFPGASELRDKIMHTNSVEEALQLLATNS
jgi:tRNA-dihydrouridine synthase